MSRNIILITWDSVRADHCSFMGYHRKTTPNLDKLARKGLYFENAIAPSVGTPASMIGVFTGEFGPLVKHVNPQTWRKEFKKRTTIAEVLSKNGYTTGAITPNAFASSYFGFDKGFNYFQDFLNTDENKTNFYKKILDKIFNSQSKSAAILRALRNYILKEELFKSWDRYYDEIINWIENTQEPFFLWILLVDTHFPYLAPPRKFRKWSNRLKTYYYAWKLQSNNFRKLSEDGIRELINAYDDSIRYADYFLDRLLKDTKDKDPIIIVTADHGDGFGEHGFYMHGFVKNNVVGMYEELIHVPLVIYNADIKGKVEYPVSLLGLGSTLFELIGIPNELPSRSFLDDKPPWIIARNMDNQGIKVAVRLNEWKFITGQKEKDELYNLKEDPYEKRNLANQKHELTKELKRIAQKNMIQEIEERKIRDVIMKLKFSS